MQNIHALKTDDGFIHFVDEGHGEVVLLVPGTMGDYRGWQQQTEVLSKQFRVIAMSRRFQFPSTYDERGSSTVEENCNDILCLLNHLEIEKTHIAGHSFGGFIALAFAEKHPYRLNKLVLEEPTVFPLITNHPKNLLRLAKLAVKDFSAATSFLRTGFKGIKPTRKFITQGKFEEAKHSILNGICGRPVNIADVHPILQQGLNDNIATFKTESNTAFKYQLSKNQIRKIQSPSFILQSNHSAAWWKYIAKTLVELLPNSKLEVINSATHWLHLDEAGEFNRVVIEFLSRK